MSKSKPSTEWFRRQKVFSDMTPSTQKLAQKFEQQFAREHHDGLLLRHAFGRALGRVIAEEGTYGSDAVGQLATYLATCPDRLYKLRTFAQTFSEEEVAQGAERRMEPTCRAARSVIG